MKTPASCLLAFSTALFVSIPALAQPMGPSQSLAPTPPMGWNSWNRFGCDVGEELIRGTAEAMVKSGMKEAGYEYVVIDDCWQVRREPDGTIVADPDRFAAGMKALADHVHALGLKFGIYSDAGSQTCKERPGSLGHEYQDARQYAAWGVDYLKYDWCHTTTQDAKAAYALIRAALDATGRPIVLSMSEWGDPRPWNWGKEVGSQLWRTTDDIVDRWEAQIPWPNGNCCGYGMVDILDMQVGLEGFAGPGHWNDPDMLEVGNGGMTATEYRSHFSLWAMLAAPLMAGNDLRNMTTDTREILTNKEVIAIDQDPLGSQGKRVLKDGDREVWVKQLQDGSRAVVLFNRGAAPQQIAVSWEAMGYPGHLKALVQDLWQHKALGTFAGKFSAPVESHGVVMIRVTP